MSVEHLFWPQTTWIVSVWSTAAHFDPKPLVYYLCVTTSFHDLLEVTVVQFEWCLLLSVLFPFLLSVLFPCLLSLCLACLSLILYTVSLSSLHSHLFLGCFFFFGIAFLVYLFVWLFLFLCLCPFILFLSEYKYIIAVW